MLASFNNRYGVDLRPFLIAGIFVTRSVYRDTFPSDVNVARLFVRINFSFSGNRDPATSHRP